MNAHHNFWKPAAVGCHWTNVAYPQATISTFVRGRPAAGQMRSGYGAWLNGELVGEFDTLALAKEAVGQLAMLRSWGVPARKRHAVI